MEETNEAMYLEYIQAKMLVSQLEKKVSRQTAKVNHLGGGYKKLCHLQDRLEVAQSEKTDALAKISEHRRDE